MPSGTSASKPASGSGPSSEQTGRVLNIPDNVRSELAGDGRTLRIRGEIVRVNEDNSVRVRTARGDVDVQLSPPRGSQPKPQVGQRVEIEIQPAPVRQPPVQTPPSGNQESSPSPSPAPRPENVSIDQVILRSVPARTPVQPESADPQQPRPSATPVDIQLRPSTLRPDAPSESRPATPPAQASTISIQGFPAAGSLIRLEPLTSQQAQQVIAAQAALQPDIIAQVLQGAVPPSNAVATSAPEQALQPALVAPRPAVIQSAVFNLPEVENFVPSSPAPLQGLGFPDASAFSVPQVAPQSPFVSSALIPPQIFQTPQVLQAAQLVGAQEAAFAPALAQDAALPVISGVNVDARIAKIEAPLVQITPPLSEASAQPPALPASLFQSAPVEDGIPLPQMANLAGSVIQNQQAGQVSGLVVGKTEYQLPVLVFFTPTAYSAFPAGVIPIYPSNEGFALTFPNESIPVGTQIQVTPHAPIISAVTSLPLTGAPLSAFLMPQNWQVMEEIYQSLIQAAPPIAQGLSAHVPSPSVPAQFGAAVLFFVSAVRGGDLNSWLGDKAVEALRQGGKGGLLSRLGQEGALLSRVSSETAGQDWRAMSVPLFWDGEIHKIALHFRHEHGKDSDKGEKGPKGTRFVFDLSLSAMGKVQIDGLFRPVSREGPRLDVILRTQEHFSGSMQAQMRRIYMDALKPSQVSGELSFQNAHTQWVTIEALKDTTLGVDA